MTDHIVEQLQKIESALLRDAEVAGEGLTKRKSKFASEMERASFIMAYGQEAYDNLED